MGFKPKIVIAEKAALMYDDIMSLPGNLPNGIVALVEWTPAITGVNGIGDTTPKSLNERWRAFSGGKPFHQMVGCAYGQAQYCSTRLRKLALLIKKK